MPVETALPVWRREFIDMLTRAPGSYLDQLTADLDRDIAWWRSRLGTPPDEEWPTAVRTLLRASEDRLGDILLERARRA